MSWWLRRQGMDGQSPEDTTSVAACGAPSASSSPSGTAGIASYRSRRRKEERFIKREYRLEIRAASLVELYRTAKSCYLSVTPKPSTTRSGARMRNRLGRAAALLRNLEMTEQ